MRSLGPCHRLVCNPVHHPRSPCRIRHTGSVNHHQAAGLTRGACPQPRQLGQGIKLFIGHCWLSSCNEWDASKAAVAHVIKAYFLVVKALRHLLACRLAPVVLRILQTSVDDLVGRGFAPHGAFPHDACGLEDWAQRVFFGCGEVFHCWLLNCSIVMCFAKYDPSRSQKQA